MIVLGLDAASDGAGAALVDADGVRGACWAGRGARPAALLMALADRALQSAGMDRASIQAVAVGVGPGSYAGVRAAVATANALAWAAGLPLVAVGSLHALAWAAGRCPGTVWAATDARRGRVYAAAYRWGLRGPEELVPPALLARADWLVRVVPPALLAGSGVNAAEDGDIPDVRLAPPSVRAGVPAAVAAIGRERLLRGERADPFRLAPLYVSEPDIGPSR